MKFRDITEATDLLTQVPLLHLTMDDPSSHGTLTITLRPAVALGRVRWWLHGEDLSDWVAGDPAAFRAAVCEAYGFKEANWPLACECLLVEADWAAVSAGIPCPAGTYPAARRWDRERADVRPTETT